MLRTWSQQSFTLHAASEFVDMVDACLNEYRSISHSFSLAEKISMLAFECMQLTIADNAHHSERPSLSSTIRPNHEGL